MTRPTPKPIKEFCKRGHPLDPEAPGADVNVGWRTKVDGSVYYRHECRICRRIAAQERPSPSKAKVIRTQGYDPSRARLQGRRACIDVFAEFLFFWDQGYRDKRAIACSMGMAYESMDRALYRAAKIMNTKVPSVHVVPPRGPGRMPGRAPDGRFLAEAA